MHRVERMIFEWAFIQWCMANKKIAHIDGAFCLRESRRHDDAIIARFLQKRIHHRADIAAICRVKGRANLKENMARALRFEPVISLKRQCDRFGRINRTAFER